MVESAISVAVGTIMAVVYQGNGFGLTSVGLILILVGAAGIAVPAMVFSWSLSSDNVRRTLNRQVTELRGGFRTDHHEIKQLTLRVLSSATTRPPARYSRRGDECSSQRCGNRPRATS